MKKYIDLSLRKSKTDKNDAIRIVNFGLDNWKDSTVWRFCPQGMIQRDGSAVGFSQIEETTRPQNSESRIALHPLQNL